MPNRITFITENNQTKATFDYENLPDVQTDAIKKVLGITPSGTINITENGDHDVTNYATASVEVEGGPQPTLFAPVVTGGVNTISWSNNTQNGGFSVTLTADVDGTTVTSPLTITQEMDGKTLTITASATNFESATTTLTLVYVSGEQSIVSISYSESFTNPATFCYPALGVQDMSGCKQIIKGTETSANVVTAAENGRNKRLAWQPDMYLLATTTSTLAFRILINDWSDTANSSVDRANVIAHSNPNTFTGTISVMRADTQEVVKTTTLTNADMSSNTNRTISGITAVEGKKYILVVNGTFA